MTVFPYTSRFRYALRGAARDRQAQAYRQLREALASPRYTRFLLRLGGWLEDRGWRPEATREAAREMALAQPLVALADALLAKRHRQALKRGRGFAKQIGRAHG